jgi:hypothetical protein
LSRYDDGGED